MTSYFVSVMSVRPPQVRTITFPSYTCYIYSVASVQYRTLVCFATSSSILSLICSFCSSGRGFAADFLQIPPHDGHPCLKLHFLLQRRVRDFHPIVIAHAGRTKKGTPGY